MNGWWLLTPIITGAIGWSFTALALKAFFHPLRTKNIAGFSLQGVVPKRQQEFALAIGKLSAALLPLGEIEEKITNPENVKKIMPQAEEHIDHFLRVKLPKSMPVVGMFVGDKTINNLKSLFIAELEQLFPEIMKNYMGRLKEDVDIEQLVTRKINDIDPAAIETVFLTVMRRELRNIKLLGTLLGIIIGALQLLIIQILR